MLHQALLIDLCSRKWNFRQVNLVNLVMLRSDKLGDCKTSSERELFSKLFSPCIRAGSRDGPHHSAFLSFNAVDHEMAFASGCRGAVAS